ncbi:universal stress protein [Streptomyces sp. LX-29]|uniref:universal stress protein n=1 Tax=Streptomyces sp. LX-29 TaxID=2900152 RepID=UPI00240D43E7|nr:universal stress protein [Streptomyces sp. LX-29]WFB06281.1 universal stress protein [Streptomyces sp. LX-29]
MTTERGRVVVGVSGSLASLAALRRGVLEARRDGRTLVAVVAWEPPEGEILYAKQPDPSWARMWEDEARQRLGLAFDEALGGVPADLRVVQRVVRGKPESALRTIAHRPNDLLVVGVSRGVGLRAWIHRSPVRRLVQAKADCPVLTVPGPHLLPSEARTLRRVEYPEFTSQAAGRDQAAA